MRMTAAGVVSFVRSILLQHVTMYTLCKIMAQMGMFVPARSARYAFHYYQMTSTLDLCFRLCPVDAILTRMGAYDNMFSNSSTFKVELDEW